VIRRLYVDNFRCLENFELKLEGLSSVLLIGNNGSGKSTVGFALEILQKIARGTNRVSELVKSKDRRTNGPIRFEIEAGVDRNVYEYSLALELPDKQRELTVKEETLRVNGQLVFRRDLGNLDIPLVPIRGTGPVVIGAPLSSFPVETWSIALPLVNESSSLDAGTDRIRVFRTWLSRRLLVLRPVPNLMRGEEEPKTLEPTASVSNFGGWFSGLLAHSPAAYASIEGYIRQVMHDFRDLKRPVDSEHAGRLRVQFSDPAGSLTVNFEDLSDGEKCFMICALVLAASYGPITCFWDEPDHYLALSEVGHFIMDLRRAFQSSGQFIATSHNPEAIRHFSYENTFFLHRKSHLAPTTLSRVDQLDVAGDLVGAMIRGDVEP
jgi:predicted ATPase